VIDHVPRRGGDQGDGESDGESEDSGEYSGNDMGLAGMGSLITINVEGKD
jgi:hypothetical protein